MGAADAELLRAYAEDALSAAGAGADDASAWADLMVHASLRGVDSHGVVSLLAVFCEQAQAGIGAAGTSPAIAEEHGAACVVEGRRAGGARTARLAMAAAAERARGHGAGVSVARSIGDFGALAWTVEPAALEGLIAVCACNAMAFVAPYGGREGLHGTNPIAVAIPAEPDPIVVDMRTNAFRMADYRAGLAEGRPLPDGVLLGPDGQFITDVAELERVGWDAAVSLPAAGAKGYGLALVVDVLTAALAGTPIGREIRGWNDEQSGLAAFFLALDPAAFGPPERFAAAVERLADQAHATAPVEEDVPVRLPGERPPRTPPASGERRAAGSERLGADGVGAARARDRAAAGPHRPRLVIVDCHTHLWAPSHLGPPFTQEVRGPGGSAPDLSADPDAHRQGTGRRCRLRLRLPRAAARGLGPQRLRRRVRRDRSRAALRLCLRRPDRDRSAGRAGSRRARARAARPQARPDVRRLASPRRAGARRLRSRRGARTARHVPFRHHAASPGRARVCPADHVDEIARRFPRLRLVIAHVAHPWEAEALVVCRKHEHVFADVSALVYRPFQLYGTLRLAIEYAIDGKLLLGSDFPWLTTAQEIDGLRRLTVADADRPRPIPQDVVEGIVQRDTLRLLGLQVR